MLLRVNGPGVLREVRKGVRGLCTISVGRFGKHWLAKRAANSSLQGLRQKGPDTRVEHKQLRAKQILIFQRHDLGTIHPEPPTLTLTLCNVASSWPGRGCSWRIRSFGGVGHVSAVRSLIP